MNFEDIKAMDLLSESELRKSIIPQNYAQEMNGQVLQKKMEENLQEAQENGMDAIQASQVRETYQEAENVLVYDNKKQVQHSLVHQVDRANQNFLKEGDSSYFQVPEKSESLLRAGIKSDSNREQLKEAYDRSVSRTIGCIDRRKELERNKLIKKGSRFYEEEKDAVSALKDLAKKSASLNKSVSFRIGKNQIEIIPKKMVNNKIGADILVNGVKQTATKAAGTLSKAVPGINIATIIVGVIKKLAEKAKEMDQKNQDMQKDAAR